MIILLPEQRAFLAVALVAILMILFLVWDFYVTRKKEQLAKERQEMEMTMIPDILEQHEHPAATNHYNSGPHPGCRCRVCRLQGEIEKLKHALEKYRSESDLTKN